MIPAQKIDLFSGKRTRKGSNDSNKPTNIEQGETKASKKKKYSLLKFKDQMINRIQKVQVPKKFLKFVKKNAKMLPQLLTKEESRKLLPKLQQISVISKQTPTKERNDKKFRELNNRLSSNLVEFVHCAENEKIDFWAIDIQTQKCYKRMPSFYFESEIKLQSLNMYLKLTKNPVHLREQIYDLQDYLDEVQFNINQQVGAKIKIFMKFVLCMNNIKELVSMNLQKIAATRIHNNILRDIVVSKSVRINEKRMKKQNTEKTITILENLKKMKSIENKLMNQMALGNLVNPEGKNKISQFYHEYCQLHNVSLKKYCCSGRPLCKYWDISYYVERGYQQNFMKIIRKYFFEISVPEKDIQYYKKAQGINKKVFMSTPTNFSPLSHSLDESYEVDIDIQITIKQNIQKEILTVFEQGMHKYSFSTDSICAQLNENLLRYKSTLLNKIINDIEASQKLPSIDQILPSEPIELSDESIEKGLKRLPWIKYEKLIDIVVNRIEQINKRIVSIVQQLLMKAYALEQQQPERCQVISAYMIEFVRICLSFTDNFLELVIKSRLNGFKDKGSKAVIKSKDQLDKYQQFQAQSMKKLIKYCKKCESHGENLKKYNSFVKNQYQQLINHNYQQHQKWLPKIGSLKEEVVKLTYENMHKSIISKELKEKLEDDNWQPIKISYQVYNCIGYIIGGNIFIKEEERKNKDMLSSSLLLEKQQSQLSRSHYKKEIYSSRFKVNECYITLDENEFKLTSSTEEMIKFLNHYLQLYDDIAIAGDKFEEKKFQLHGKVTQLILMYNQYMKDLILKSEALKFNKIKTKSITARHLLVAYAQLKIIDLFYCGKILQERIKISVEECSVMHGKLTSTMKDIQLKFRKILHERIQTTIKEIRVKDENVFETEPFLSVIKNINSSVQLFKDLLYDEQIYQGFIDIVPTEANWVESLLNRVNKGSKGKQTKYKCFQFLLNELQPNIKYLPNLKIAAESVVN